MHQVGQSELLLCLCECVHVCMHACTWQFMSLMFICGMKPCGVDIYLD